MRLCLFCLILPCLFGFRGEAQSVIPRFETLGVNEGLSQSSVYSIHQDKFGFMWFGTANGLNRYDGSGVRVYKIQDNRLDIESNYIRGKLCEDSAGNIWFSNEAGIHVYEHRTDRIKTVRTFPKGQFQGGAFEGVFLKDNILWMLNHSIGIFGYSVNTGTLQSYPHPVFAQQRTHYPLHPAFDAEGNIWVTSFQNDGIYRFSTRSKSFAHVFPRRHYMNISFGKKKHFLVSPGGTLQVYDSVSQRIEAFPFSQSGQALFKASQVLEDRFGRYWTGSIGAGLACYDAQTRRTTFFRHDNAKLKSLPIDLITTLFIDRHDNLWIGTDGGGVSRLDLKPQRFHLFPLNEGDHPQLKDYFTKCFYEDDKGRIWFGSHNNGFSIYDPLTGDLQNFGAYKGRSLHAVGAITKDPAGNLWIGYGGGFLHFDESKKSFTPVPLWPRVNLLPWEVYVYDIQPLQNGDLLAATAWGMVHFTRKNGRFSGRTYYGAKDLGWTATSVRELSRGDIWVASPTGGLLHLQLHDTLHLKERFFEGVNLRSLHVDEGDKNILWLCTAKGLIRFDITTRRYRVYTEKDGMADSYVYGVLEDAQHNFWLSTNGGLVYFDRKRNSFQNFTANDGLQSNEFNTGAFYKGPSGRFYFGGIKGFNWFQDAYPDTKPSAYRPGVAVTGVFVNDRPWPKDDAFVQQQTMQLSHRQNNLAFHVAALDFTRPQANKIQYRLEGWDPDWFTTQTQAVRYPHLAPGRYIFKIKAANADGNWSEEQQFTITIDAPYWQRWWFYGMVSVMVLAAAVVITRYMTQRKLRRQLRELEKQRAVEAERNRISKDMHDEIGSGLTHIALMSELMQTQKKAADELKKDVGTISASARKLVQSMSEIVWALNPQNDTLESLLAYVREQAQEYFEPFAIELSLPFPEVIPAVRLSNENRRHVFLVAKEALHNVLKHAGATWVECKVAINERSVHFYISDNGKGFDQTTIGVGSNGLHNMQKRMASMNGSFSLHTGANGTLVHFSFPISSRKPFRKKLFFLSKGQG